MNLRSIVTSTAPAAKGPYSQAIEWNGMLFVSGQVGLDPESLSMVPGGFEAEARQVFRNIEQILIAGGSDMNHVLRSTVYLADIGNFQRLNEIYAEHFGAHKPARTTFQAAALPIGAEIEIDVIAAVVRPSK